MNIVLHVNVILRGVVMPRLLPTVVDGKGFPLTLDSRQAGIGPAEVIFCMVRKMSPATKFRKLMPIKLMLKEASGVCVNGKMFKTTGAVEE